MYNEETIKSAIKFNKMAGKEIKRLREENKELEEKLSDIRNYLKQLKHYQIEYDLGLGLNKINGCEEDFVKDILEIIGDI